MQVTRGSNPQPAVLETAALPIELVTCANTTLLARVGAVSSIFAGDAGEGPGDYVTRLGGAPSKRGIRTSGVWPSRVDRERKGRSVIFVHRSVLEQVFLAVLGLLEGDGVGPVEAGGAE